MLSLKERWIEALRSGKYAQGQGALRKVARNEYCCLGVLCDLCDPSRWTDTNSVDVYWYDGVSNLPPQKVQHAVGMDQLVTDKLAVMNDGGATFDQIANYIEKNL